MRRARPLLLLLLLVGALASNASAAVAAPLIERVWSFNGGEIAIQAQGQKFVGTVVAPTKFAQCSHPVGEQIWTNISLQPDGSYWGLHHWFFETAECIHNPTLGASAWRVMETSNEGHYLLVCFSTPGTAQPTIAPSGATTNVSYGCVKSAEIAPVPIQAAPISRSAAQSFTRAVTLPNNARCFSRRIFQIHLRDPRYDPLRQVVVTIGGRRVAVVRRGKVFAATIDLRGLPHGAFTVKIVATTVLGHHLYGRRSYHTCVGRPARSSKPKPLRPTAHGPVSHGHS